jgi:hypothetical protein
MARHVRPATAKGPGQCTWSTAVAPACERKLSATAWHDDLLIYQRAPFACVAHQAGHRGQGDDRCHDRGADGLTEARPRRDGQFDAGYYRRFYVDRETAVITPGMQRHEVAFVIAFCRHIGLGIVRFTDVGAGTGWWAKEFRKRYRTCRHIETFDASEAACRLYGHRRVAAQKIGGPQSDLVVCRDVLRYLPARDAEEAIRRLARKCRGVLYLHVITSDDDIDEDASDMSGFFRTVGWYTRRLRRAGFRDCGMGLFVSNKFAAFDPFAIEVTP